MRTVTKLGESSLNISRSKFLGYCKPITNEFEAEEFLKEIKRKHPQAKHIVYVYKVEPNIVKKFNSSEPSGTGAPPILSIIEKNQLTNIVVAVVRYFGGVLLGTGGLVRAYGDTATEAITTAIIKELTMYHKYQVKLKYNEVSIIEKLDLIVLDRDFSETIKYTVATKSDNLPFDDVIYLEDVWL